MQYLKVVSTVKESLMLKSNLLEDATGTYVKNVTHMHTLHTRCHKYENLGGLF